MNLFSIIGLLCAAAVSVASVAADGGAATQGEKSWGYKNNDPSMYGPAEWGAHYPKCAGKRQSPIDISLKSACGDDTQEAPLKFAGECSDYRLKQFEDTYKGEVQNGALSFGAIPLLPRRAFDHRVNSDVVYYP